MDCQSGDAQQVGGIKITPSPEFQRHLQRHRNRREPGANRYEDNQIFFQDDKVYYINGIGHIDKRQIGTIVNKNENGSSFGEPSYTVNFKNVSDDTKIIKNPNCHQSDIVLVLPEDLMQRGGKNRKISKKNRKSKHRKSKHRKSKKSN